MEIKPQDLRLGNLIGVDDEVASVTAIGKISVYFTRTSGRRGSEHLTSISGIELTPEWLERCYAIKRTEITSEIIFGTYRSLEIVKDIDGYRLHLTSTTGGNISLRKIKYLHQLQNSYHGVFGEELAIDKTL